MSRYKPEIVKIALDVARSAKSKLEQAENPNIDAIQKMERNIDSIESKHPDLKN